MDSSDAAEADDQRVVEMETLSAIFPELKIGQDNPYTFSYDIPVKPSKEVTVFFPAPADPVAPPRLPAPTAVAQIDSHGLSHLPPIHIEASLPVGYPEKQPPLVKVSTSPPWLPEAVTLRLEGECRKLWDELGHDIVIYSFLDQILQAGEEDVFGLLDASGTLQVDPEHKIAILDHDIKSKKAAFDAGTFECGICLGQSCYKNCFREFL
jgi:E3 ubiquitin-protein ligase RNF14